MPKNFCALFAALLLAAPGCGSGPQAHDVCGTVVPGQVEPQAGPEVRAEPPARGCADLQRAALEVVGEHNACTQDADCMKPSPVCRDGRCKHEAPQASCEQLDRDAEALLAQHNECASDDD